MQVVTILNVPNYYSSYFVLGLSRLAHLRFSPRPEFAHLNNKPFLVIEVNGKVIVIENDDPVGVDQKSYEACDLYFATNKIKSREDYNWPKTRPLYPHYTIALWADYLRIFGLQGARTIGLKEFVRQAYILYQRPEFENLPFKVKEGNYVFFSGNIWKKESWANEIRASYIAACQNHPLIEFEGGMVPRTDGDRCGLPLEVMNRKYTPREFAKKSSQSLIGFNNPAVLDAVSWRLAEYLNYGCFIISFPFKIQVPLEPVHGQAIHYVQEAAEFSDLITYAMTHEDYRKKLARGAKDYFEMYCLPEKQAKMILESH